MKRLLCAILLLVLLCTVHASAQIELMCINVGKGDAILLRAGAYCCLIDAGKKSAREQVERALEAMGIGALDAVFLTHTDKDHSGGLKWLEDAQIKIGAIYASRYYPESSEKKHPANKLAKARGLEVQWLGAGDRVPIGDEGALLEVLAPEREISDNEDDHSLVMMLCASEGRVLLAGDMELGEEALLLASGAQLNCDVLKVPNHGDGDACSRLLVEACMPQIAIISTDSCEKQDTPDPRVLRDLREAGCVIYETQHTELGIYLALTSEGISIQEV